LIRRSFAADGNKKPRCCAGLYNQLVTVVVS